MKRLIAGAFAAALLFSGPALAQSLTDQVAAQLAAQGLSLDTASTEDIAAATEAVFDSAIAAQLALTGLTPATATAEQLGQAAAALVANNPGLSDGALAALTSAAVKSNPGAASQIVGAVVAQRPAAAVAVTRAAVAANPTQVNQIAAAAAQAATNGGQRGLVGQIVANAVAVANANNVGATINDVSAAVSDTTGIDVATVVDEATSSVIVADAEVQELVDQDEDEEDLLVNLLDQNETEEDEGSDA